MDFDGGPAWLRYEGTVTKAASVPDAMIFHPVKENLTGAKKATITLKSKTASTVEDYVFTVTPDFTAPELTSATTMTLAALADGAVPSIEITGNAFGGSTILADQSPEWLTYDAMTTADNNFTYKVSLIPGDDKDNFPATIPADQTITLASNIAPDKKTTVTVKFTDQSRMEEDINQDVIETNGDYRVTTEGKTLTLTVYSIFVPTIETAYAPGYGNNTGWLPAPGDPKTSGYSDNRRKFTYEITVPPAGGTDAAYQLHKGTIAIKQGTTEVKKITLWRGASNIPYPTGRSDNGYYSAVLKGGLWWAPLNLGASRIAINPSSVACIGKLYQWGRNVATTYGSTNQTPGPTSNEDATDEFITAPSSPYNWLTPKNDYLWRDADGKKTDKDPCPEGWRVPTDEELAKWEGRNSNRFSSVYKITGENGIDLLLPVAGLRYNNGQSVYQGSIDYTGQGYYWSSSPIKGSDDDRAVYISLFMDRVRQTSDYVGCAFSIRCVKE